MYIKKGKELTNGEQNISLHTVFIEYHSWNHEQS